MAVARVQGTHRIEVRDRHGRPSDAVLELRYRRAQLLPPVAKQKQYQPVAVTAIYAQERGTPKNRDRIDWKLLTDLPVGTPNEALEKLRWYALRWKSRSSTKSSSPAAASRPWAFAPRNRSS